MWTESQAKTQFQVIAERVKHAEEAYLNALDGGGEAAFEKAYQAVSKLEEIAANTLTQVDGDIYTNFHPDGIAEARAQSKGWI